MEKTAIGLDFGTDSVRALLVQVADGRELAEAVQYYPRWRDGRFCRAGSAEFRQHPLDYLEAMTAAVRTVCATADPAQVVAIGVDATGSTPCATDAAGTPLALAAPEQWGDNPDAMFILWKDHSAIAEAEALRDAAQAYLVYCGGDYSCEWFWSKLWHLLRADAAVAAATCGFVELCDWLPAELTGTAAPEKMRRGRCTAGHKAMWHPDWGGLPPVEFFAGLDSRLGAIRRNLYTATFTAEKPVGHLTAAWAAKLGLPTTVTVAGGALDAHVGAVGAGIEPGTLVKTLGTSSSDLLTAANLNRRVPGICGQVDGSIVPGLTGLEAGQAAFGDIFAWFRRLLEYNGTPVALSRLEADAAALPVGANGVAALDWFNGRRTPDLNDRLRGALCNLSLDAGAPTLYRALVEAALFGTRAILDRYRSADIAVNAVTAIGGISHKSAFIMQTAADILQLPVAVSASEQTCALGAAMLASVAAGAHPDVPTAMRRMNPGVARRYRPDATRAAQYDALFADYRRLGAACEAFTARK